MSLMLSRTRIAPRVVNVVNAGPLSIHAALKQSIVRCPASGHFIPRCRRLSHLRMGLQRGFASQTDNASARPDPLKPSLSVEEVRLQAEFESNNDVRDYLQKWQETHTNHFDPVRGPGTANVVDPSEPWLGNMLNDSREAHDTADILRKSDDDFSEFSSLGDEGHGMGQFLEPGDMVVFRSSDGILTFAIYIREIEQQQQFYTERGKWRVSFSKDIDYVIKGFAPQELLAALYPHIPDGPAQRSTAIQAAIEGGVPRPLGAPLLQMMGDFDRKLHEFYLSHSNRLDTIHDIVADEQQRLDFTLEQLACKALGIEAGKLDNVVLFAVHQAVRRAPFLLDNDRTSVFTNHYVSQPKSAVELLDTVTTWVHEHQEYLIRAITSKDVSGLKDHPLQQFIQKAQRLIRLSRKVRSPTTMSSVGPSGKRFQPGDDGKPMVFREVPTERFTVADRTIIEFLQLWAVPPRRLTSGVLRSAGSHIMRATGMYTSLEVHAASAPLFLQELGVISPWENLRLLDQSLALPRHGISQQSDQMWEDVQQAAESLRTAEPVDTMKDMRKDWGDLPVYCVDSATAEEIDDGVSLERIPNSDDTFWIRVHVANPSAFIAHDDIIMKYAAERTQTVYVPERTYPMLPSSLTQSQFSLAPGRPTLTFSAKMNLQGDVLDTEISNGTIRNVIFFTHEKLQELFEPDGDGPTETLTVGGKFINRQSRPGLQETLSDDDKNTFHTLRRLMLAFRQHRVANGALEFPSNADNTVAVTAGTEPMKPYDMNVPEGRYYLGDPIIQLQSRSVNPHEVPDQTKRNLIAPLMNLACWISGKWLAERNIPAVFDGTWYHPEYPRVTNKNLSEFGGRNKLRLVAPKGISTTSPIPHTTLGLDAYVRSTSPLRRYVDLIAHYQIEAALRFEHEHNRRFDATQDQEENSNSSPVLPFSKPSIDQHLTTSRPKASLIRSTQGVSAQFWACSLLFRAFYFAECPLPATFPVLLQMPYSSTSLATTQFGQGYAGVITSLGVRCQVLVPDGYNEEVDILDVVDARIVGVEMSRCLVIMEITALKKKWERVGEWA